MIVTIVILYFALSVGVSAALIAACALSGRLLERSQECSLCEINEAMPAIVEIQIAKMPIAKAQIAEAQIAEAQRPKPQLQPSLSTQ